MAGFFITGTDTDSGKTLVTLALMRKLQQSGLKVNAMKPVAAGISHYESGDFNEDAVLLQQQCSEKPDYQQLNPYLFDAAIAPHIAAQQHKVVVEEGPIKQSFASLQKQADITLVEGAGGWLVPLTKKMDISDLPLMLQLPVVLVVGVKLGCLNHARLSMQSIQAKGCQVSGWIGTQVEKDMPVFAENISTLNEYLEVPCLGVIPYLLEATAESAADYMNIEQLVK